MIFNGVECFAYLITISNSLTAVPQRLRQTHTHTHAFTEIYNRIAIQQLHELCVRREREMFKYFAMCGIFNAKQNYIYSEGMQ